MTRNTYVGSLTAMLHSIKFNACYRNFMTFKEIYFCLFFRSYEALLVFFFLSEIIQNFSLNLVSFEFLKQIRKNIVYGSRYSASNR